ncbi:MAG: transposase [Planctomycetota bacterium]|jgi:putative transposase
MPRIARIVAVGYPHHVTQRGNNKEKIFIDDTDYLHYLKWLEQYTKEYKLSILAYCLMPNHIHSVVVPLVLHALSKCLKICHMLYSQYFNRKEDRVGHLWQGRFHSCVLDEKHLYAAIRYVETNPVRAKLVQKPEDWKWSSARAHIGMEKSIVSLGKISDFMDISNWGNYLRLDQEKMIEEIRENTLTGRSLRRDTGVCP